METPRANEFIFDEVANFHGGDGGATAPHKIIRPARGRYRLGANLPVEREKLVPRTGEDIDCRSPDYPGR